MTCLGRGGTLLPLRCVSLIACDGDSLPRAANGQSAPRRHASAEAPGSIIAMVRAETAFSGLFLERIMFD